MTTPRERPARWILAPLLSLALVLGAGPAAAQDTEGRSGGDDNEAVAVNTEDGGSVFRFALSVRRVADGVVDQTNTASAQASCTDCETVAVAFQVLLVSGDPNVVVPENLAVAANSECAECFTYAAATQLVIDADGKRLTPEGQQRLAALQQRMREVEADAPDMTEAELLQAVQEAEVELVAIFSEELVAVDENRPDDLPPGQGTTSSSTTSTTADGSGVTSTSTTSEPSSTTTTTTETTTTAVAG